LGGGDDEVFLGKNFTRNQQMSEETAQTIDREIRKLIRQAEETASKILTGNTDKLHALARSLLQYEVLDSSEIDRILAGEPLQREPVRALLDEEEA
jgi:cell division protease FtsH